jgi:hypothetical protein
MADGEPFAVVTLPATNEMQAIEEATVVARFHARSGRVELYRGDRLICTVSGRRYGQRRHHRLVPAPR